MIPSSQLEPDALAEPSDRGPGRPCISRARLLALAALLLLAIAAFRYSVLSQVPVIAKDGVGYCWNARALAEYGAAALQRDDFNQHPLFPLAILAVQRLFIAAGAIDSPDTWQRAGQAVAFSCGGVLLILVGWLTGRVVRSVAPARCPRRTALWAMLIAGVLPLNTALSVDVLSEPLFFVPYLLGAVLIVGLGSRIAAVASTGGTLQSVLITGALIGLCAGLAFLVRPEGAAIGLGAAAVLLRSVRKVPLRRLAAAGAALVGGFLLCAGPYWAVLGKLSPKEGKQEIQEFRSAPGHAGSGLILAATNYEVYHVGTALLEAGRETFRAGRVVVVLLAIAALAAWRRRLFSPAIIGLTIIAAVHFSLCVLLLLRHGYLDQRHTLAVVLLLIPGAAATLDWLVAAVRQRGRPTWGVLAAAALLSPLAIYSLRIPHRDEAHLREAAAEIVAEAAHEHAPTWVTQRPPGLILGGSSIRRVAFYADATYAGYAENKATIDERITDLRWRLIANPPVADWFVIEAAAKCEDPSNELDANRALLDRLFADPETAAALAKGLPPMEMAGGATLHVFRVGALPPAPSRSIGEGGGE